MKNKLGIIICVFYLINFDVKAGQIKITISNIEEKIGIKVFIKNKKNNSGQVTLEYKDLDQLNRLIEVIKVNY